MNRRFFDVSMARTTQFERKNRGLGFLFQSMAEQERSCIFRFYLLAPQTHQNSWNRDS